MEFLQRQEEVKNELNKFFTWRNKIDNYDNYSDAICEYLSFNALDFDIIHHMKQEGSFIFNGIEIIELTDTIVFDFDSKDPYVFWEYFSKPIFYYGPSNKKNIIDVINHDNEVMSFKIDLTKDTYQYYKQYINGTTALVEEYDANQEKVVARIYDIDEVRESIRKIEQDNSNKVQSSWNTFIETPTRVCGVNPEFIVSIELNRRDNHNAYYYVVIRNNKELIKAEKFPLEENETIYSAYQRYMDENIFFKEDYNQNKKVKK